MADVIFFDYSIKVKNAIERKINATLSEVSGEMVSAVVRNYDNYPRVDTGQTKNSFQYKIVESEHTSYIGSNHQNAIWEEFGTGEYSLKGNGRKGGWKYVDAKGKGHFTYGKKPSRAFWNAYTALKNKIINRIQNSLKGL